MLTDEERSALETVATLLDAVSEAETEKAIIGKDISAAANAGMLAGAMTQVKTVLNADRMTEAVTKAAVAGEDAN